MWVSFGRSSLEASAFLKKVRDACDVKLPRVFVDGLDINKGIPSGNEALAHA